MDPILKSIAQLMVIISGVLLIIGGLTKKEKFSANKKLQKRMLFYGIVIVILTLVISAPDIYSGFISGWNDGAR